MGHLMWVTAQIAEKEGLNKDGYRVVINNGKQGGKSIYILIY